MHLIKDFLQDEAGQGLVEYTSIIALVSVVAIVALHAVGNNANAKLANAATNISS